MIITFITFRIVFSFIDCLVGVKVFKKRTDEKSLYYCQTYLHNCFHVISFIVGFESLLDYKSSNLRLWNQRLHFRERRQKCLFLKKLHSALFEN